MSIGRAIQFARNLAHKRRPELGMRYSMTRAQLSAMIDITLDELRVIELGFVVPPQDVIESIVEATGVDAAQLAKWQALIASHEAGDDPTEWGEHILAALNMWRHLDDHNEKKAKDAP